MGYRRNAVPLYSRAPFVYQKMRKSVVLSSRESLVAFSGPRNMDSTLALLHIGQLNGRSLKLSPME